MSQKSRENISRHRRGASSSPTARKAPTIVVPLDGSAHATAALPVARVMAEIEGAAVHVVHVGAPLLPPREVLTNLRLTLEQVRGTVVDQTAGTPAAGIVRLAGEWESRLIEKCTHTGLTTQHGELGPVAEEVLRTAPCPVVLVRPVRGLQPWALHRILLPHDGTPSMALAAGPAADLAHRAGAELLVLHVATAAARPVEPGTFAGPRYLDQPQHEWPTWTHEFLDRLRRLGHPPMEVKMRLLLARGDPGPEVVRCAAEHSADLIVLGWHGELEERAATMKAVIGAAPCPVLVVRVQV